MDKVRRNRYWRRVQFWVFSLNLAPAAGAVVHDWLNLGSSAVHLHINTFTGSGLPAPAEATMQLMDRIDLRPSHKFPHTREQDEAVPSSTMGAIHVLARLAIYFLSLPLAQKSPGVQPSEVLASSCLYIKPSHRRANSRRQRSV